MIKSLFSPRPLNTDLFILLLRLVFGGMFIYFGYGKLVGFNEMLPMFGDIIGIGAKPSLILVVFAEFFCGIFVALGLLTRLSVIPIFITMIVAFFIAHAEDPFAMKHAAFVYMLLSVVIFVGGSGRYSVDALIFKQTK
ncbi:DoxX family protein [soil metagenome]